MNEKRINIMDPEGLTDELIEDGLAFDNEENASKDFI